MNYNVTILVYGACEPSTVLLQQRYLPINKQQ